MTVIETKSQSLHHYTDQRMPGLRSIKYQLRFLNYEKGVPALSEYNS